MDFNLSVSAFTQEKNFKPLSQDTVYDVMIIGGGPAGLTAAVYCMRKGAVTGLIVKELGGQVAETSGIENYPGYKFINGVELADKFREQVLQFSIGFDEGAAVKSITDGQIKQILLDDGREFSARAIIITTGKSSKKLNVPGEFEFAGKGVAYCATCDAPFFTGKKVAVIGGGNSGIEAAIDLARLAKKVSIVQFLPDLTGDAVLIDRLRNFGNVDYYFEHEVVSIKGDEKVRSIEIRGLKSGDSASLAVDGVFVEIGLIPNSGFAKGLLDMNQSGEIIIDHSCRTNVTGIFAAGDITTVPYKQIIIAAGEGAKAALSACDYILKY